MNNRRRVLIIGLDGFTWKIGDQLIQRDYMPRLVRLRNKGAYGNLKSVYPYETCPAWSSFQTGCLPGKTGIFTFHSYDKINDRIQLNSFDNIRVPSIWELASQAGKRVVSVNLPMTSPPPSVEGIIVPGLTCPGLSAETIYPSDIYERYINQYPDYKIVNKEKQPSLKDYVDVAIQTEETRCDLSLKMMQEQEWDIFCVEMQSTDFFQHRNWWGLDPAANGYTEEAFQTSALFYHKIDLMIQRLIQAAGEDTLVCIVSDHGFCALEAELGINTWLYQNHFLTLKSSRPSTLTSFKQRLKGRNKLIKYLAVLYGRVLHKLVGKDDSLKDTGLYAEILMRHIREIIDISKTDAFCLGGLSGLLYVDPEMKRDPSIIVEGLLQEYGTASSNPLITDIVKTETLYGIDHKESFYPDYIILLADGIANHIQPDGDVVIRRDQSSKQGGTHDPNGVFVLSGGGVCHKPDSHSDIVDIIPTILAYLGLPVPNHMDGRVLNELFESELNTSYYDYDLSSSSKSTGVYSDEEQSAVEKQLKDLGYL